MRSRGTIASLLLLAAVGVGCLAAAEAAIRALQLLDVPPDLSRGHPERGYQLRPGFDGTTPTGVRLQINALGMRGPETTREKPPGTRRVLILGDSVTFGWGVAEPDTFPRRLELQLGAELACPVEVLNAGVSGYGSIEEEHVFQHEGLALDPDVVVIYQVENDNVIATPARGALAAWIKDRIVYRSHLVNAAIHAVRVLRWKALASQAGGDAAAYAALQRSWPENPGSAESLAALRRIFETARAHGIRVVLASHPNNFADPSLDVPRVRALRALAEGSGVAFVDAAPGLLAHENEGLTVSATDMHPNGRGHALIAAALLPALRDALGCARRSS
jgi:lysophospholipase L1-like esterase